MIGEIKKMNTDENKFEIKKLLFCPNFVQSVKKAIPLSHCFSISSSVLLQFYSLFQKKITSLG